MEMEYLSIQKIQNWDPTYKPGAYRGIVKYKNQNGEIVINLSTEIGKKIISIVAEDLVAASREVANTLTGDVLTHAALSAPVTETPIIEAPTGDDIPF